jgi:hypothetical protein
MDNASIFDPSVRIKIVLGMRELWFGMHWTSSAYECRMIIDELGATRIDSTPK